jgi:predicted metal-dependent phosphoesterase TrpH
MAFVDLHLHTTASDGRLSPSELVRYLDQRGVKIAAITDHDSTEGLPEALAAGEEFPHLTLIPGVELSTDVPGGEIHMLGYFLSWRDQGFQETLGEFRRGRVGRAQGMVEKLAELGMKVEWERVQELAEDGAVGRPHVARAMMERGYVAEFREAFDKYIGRNGPAYVERKKLLTVDAIALIREAGGAAVLAHPTWVDDLETHLGPLKEAGLAGIEVHYGSYSPDVVVDLAQLAQRYDLIPCGGSDYHAMGAGGEAQPGDQGPPEKSVEELWARATNPEESGSTWAPSPAP